MQYRDVIGSLNLCGLPEDLLSQKCRDEHLPDISLKFRWRMVAPFLHLSEQQVEDILADARWEQERRIMTLRMWLQTFGTHATYGCLMRALLKADLQEQAMNVALVLIRSLRPRPRILRPSSDTTSSSSDQEFHTPPQSPPRPPRRTMARHTQTEPYRVAMPGAMPVAQPAAVGGTERVCNEYTPLPRARRNEQAFRSYLSTSLTLPPFKDTATQTEDLPFITSSVTTVPDTPPPVPNTHLTTHRTFHSHAFRQGDVERSVAAFNDHYSRKCICLFLLVPILGILGILILVIVIIYVVAYMHSN